MRERSGVLRVTPERLLFQTPCSPFKGRGSAGLPTSFLPCSLWSQGIYCWHGTHSLSTSLEVLCHIQGAGYELARITSLFFPSLFPPWPPLTLNVGFGSLPLLCQPSVSVSVTLSAPLAGFSYLACIFKYTLIKLLRQGATDSATQRSAPVKGRSI